MSNNPSSIISFIKGKDTSPYLFHFTKGCDPLLTLHKILEQNVLKSRLLPYVCFTESPLLAMKDVLDYFQTFAKSRYSLPMFDYYGIGIKKELLFNLGARPVIYGSIDEKELIDDSIKWRFELLDFKKHDFAWLREWRIGQQEFELPEDDEDVLILCKTEVESKKLRDKFNRPCISFQYIEESQSSDEFIDMKVSSEMISEFELECLRIECEEIALKHGKRSN